MKHTWKYAAVALCLSAITASATIKITPGTGGTGISADTAANGVAPAWTTIGTINLQERSNGHRNRFAQQTNGVLILKAPVGFEFNDAVTPSATFTPGNDMQSASIQMTPSTLTLTITVTNENAQDSLDITGLQVRPTSASPLASGNIYRPAGLAGGNAKIIGLKSTSNVNGVGGSVFAALSEVAAAATSLTFRTQPSTHAIATVPLGAQPVVAISDMYGNVKTNAAATVVTASILSGPGTLGGTTSQTTIAGISTYTNLVLSDAGTVTLLFSAPGLNSLASQPITVDAIAVPPVATALKLVTPPSTTATAGANFAQQPAIAIMDQYDAVMTNDSSTIVTVERVDGTGTLQGTLTAQASSGVATFVDLHHNVAETISLKFSSGSFSNILSDSILVSPAAADRLIFTTQPGAAVVGSPFGVQPVVESRDAFGNPSDVGLNNTLNVTMTLTSGTGTLQGTTVLDIGTDVGDGAVSFTNLRIDNVGTNKQLTASASGLTAGVSSFFIVAASGQTITFDPLTNKTFGDAAFTVSATASSGLPVSFSVVSGPATIVGDTVTLTGAGTVTIRASQAGTEDYSSAVDVDRSFTVAKASQTITFDPLTDKTYGDAAFGLTASASSGLPISYTVLSGPASVTGNTVTITGTGAVTIRASQLGNTNYNAATSVEQSFTVNKADQTISFGALSGKTFGDAAFTVSATASSGLPVSFSIASGPATVLGDTVTITGAGTVTIRASQAGNTNYNAATDVDQGFTVNKANQTITFGALGNKTFGDAPFTVDATSDSGLAVTFSILSGPATVSGNTVTITNAGSVTVRASQAGNTNYNAATDVDQSFTVNKADQTITFGPLSNKTYGDAPFDVSATTTSGLTVSFSIVSGPATISGSTITITNTGTVTVRASQAGNSSYNAAPDVEQSFTVGKAEQTISFGTLSDKTYGDAPFAVSATATSGLTVSFSIVSGPATISGSTITITNTGTVVVRASQSGNGNYNAAPDVDRSFAVNKANQTISFSPLLPKTYGAPPFSVSATATSGLTVSFSIVSGPATISGTTVTITNVGTVIVRASQSGNANYNAAPDVDRSFTVSKANQSITFGSLANKVYGDAPFTLSATASSGLPVSFSVFSGPAEISGSTVTLTGAGSVTIVASQAGDSFYNAASNAVRSFTVAKANQTITFGPLANKNVNDPAFTVSATASSSLQVSFTIESGPATVSGNTITLTGASGTVVVRASQTGNTNYNAASYVEQSFDVSQLAQTITFDALTNQVYGVAPFTIVGTASSGLPVSFTIVSGQATVSNDVVTVTEVGTVTIRASQAGDSTYSAAANVERSFEVTPAALTVSSDSTNRIVNTANPTFTGSISGLVNGDNITATYSTTADSSSAVGTYPITIALDDPDGRLANYNVTTNEGTLTVEADPIPQIVTNPESVSIAQGTPLNLTVVASGTALEYQWRTNGSAVSGATSSTFTIVNARVPHSGNYDVVVSNSSGSVTSAVAQVEVYMTAGDFDENGQADIMFQSADGQLALWYLQGTNFLGSSLLRGGKPVGAGWNLLAQNDLDGDGMNDLVFQDNKGRVAVWLMDNTNVASSILLRQGHSAGGTWHPISINDFNKDGKKDILFQNARGNLGIWYMNDLGFITPTRWNGDKTIGKGWNTVGTADFNGDKQADVVFQNKDGRIAVWIMDGSEVTSVVSLRTGPAASSGWKIVGVADFDGDRDADLLWQHTNGRLAIWTFDGTQFVGSASVNGGQTQGPGWKAVGSR